MLNVEFKMVLVCGMPPRRLCFQARGLYVPVKHHRQLLSDDRCTNVWLVLCVDHDTCHQRQLSQRSSTSSSGMDAAGAEVECRFHILPMYLRVHNAQAGRLNYLLAFPTNADNLSFSCRCSRDRSLFLYVSDKLSFFCRHRKPQWATFRRCSTQEGRACQSPSRSPWEPWPSHRGASQRTDPSDPYQLHAHIFDRTWPSSGDWIPVQKHHQSLRRSTSTPPPPPPHMRTSSCAHPVDPWPGPVFDVRKDSQV